MELGKNYVVDLPNITLRLLLFTDFSSTANNPFHTSSVFLSVATDKPEIETTTQIGNVQGNVKLYHNRSTSKNFGWTHYNQTNL